MVAVGASVLQVVPLVSARILFPGLALRMPLPDDQQRLQMNDSVVCVPLLASHRSSIKQRNSSAGATVGIGNTQSSNCSDQTADATSSAPATHGLFNYGCIARVSKVIRARLGAVKSVFLKLEGITRARIDSVKMEDGSMTLFAQVSELADQDLSDSSEIIGITASLREAGHSLVTHLSNTNALSPSIVQELYQFIDRTPISQLTYVLIGLTKTMTFEERIVMLHLDLKERMQKLLVFIAQQSRAATISSEIRTKVEDDLLKKRREIYLRQQMNAIKKELGEEDDGVAEDELKQFEKRLTVTLYPEEIVKISQHEIRRMKGMQSSMAEYHVLLNYLDWLLSLPWKRYTEDNLSIAQARQQLDKDHSGLEKVKKRVLEHLAVTKITRGLKGPILCFHGPPGVGKTSLGKSIADSMGRKFGRIALGGVRDETEIRGHRRTYVGAMPGALVQALRKTGSSNPVILLDEIDKLGKDFRGDPASALLEVLDPEQNRTFHDHYLNTPLDLSQVLFIATANDLDTIARPLLDRMEIITLSGYTPQEKYKIACGMLIPKQLILHGLRSDLSCSTDTKVDMNQKCNAVVTFTDTVIQRIVSAYTHEAGVRNLEREIAAVCRYVAMRYAEWMETEQKLNQSVHERSSNDEAVDLLLPYFQYAVDLNNIEEILGPLKYDDEFPKQLMVPGLAVGLAWTSMGIGSVLFIESSYHAGSGKLHLTGKLGSILQESAQIALSWLRTNAYKLRLVEKQTDLLWKDKDIHVHLPAGAVPKDGPSAGITLVASLVGLALEVPMKCGVAMTGEITLRGDVLPVGGIKEKALAAYQLGIRTLIMPSRNRKSYDDIPANVQQEMTFIWVETIGDMLLAAFDAPEQLHMLTKLTSTSLTQEQHEQDRKRQTNEAYVITVRGTNNEHSESEWRAKL